MICIMIVMNIKTEVNEANGAAPRIERFADGSLAPVEGVTAHWFSAGEAHLNFAGDAPVEGGHYVITVRGGELGGLAEAAVFADGLRRQGARTVTLYAPYLPAARQDRGVPFTGKIAADLINLGGYELVIAADPHSPVVPALVRNFVAIEPADTFPEFMLPTDGTVSIIAPDKGAAARARAVAERYALPVVQADKYRDPARNYAVTGYSCPDITTDYAVVVDDICDGGGTFLALADAVGLDRDRLRLWTTHGIYARGIGVLEDRYAVVGCTDSLESGNAATHTSTLRPALIDTLTTHFA